MNLAVIVLASPPSPLLLWLTFFIFLLNYFSTDVDTSRNPSGSNLVAQVSINQLHASFAEDLYANVELVRLQILDFGIEARFQKNQSMAFSGSLKILSQIYNTTLLDWEPLLDYAYLSVEGSADPDSMGNNKQDAQVLRLVTEFVLCNFFFRINFSRCSIRSIPSTQYEHMP